MEGMKTVFEVENIKFVELTELFIPDYLKSVKEDNVASLLGISEEEAEEDEIYWIRMNIEKKAPVFPMIEKKTGEFIGSIELMNVNDLEGEISITIIENMRDKGYGSEAVSAIVKYGMKELKLNRIILSVAQDNLRAIHVYEKCGFREYGRTEEDILMEIMITDDNE